VPVEETLRTLDTLVTSGKVRYVGISNWCGWQVQRALDLAGFRDWSPVACLQPLYNLLDREAEWELLPVARANGLGVIPWSPLRSGWLTGKYRRDMAAAPPGTRVDDAESHENWSERWANYGTERTWAVLDELDAVAAETGRELSQVALNWLLQQPGVTAPIIGARTMAQFEANLGAAGWDLDPAHVARLTRVSDRPLPHPYDVLARSGRSPD
jgi:aryl-alcohol dehydrogenase-like predicted oxidoreductase